MAPEMQLLMAIDQKLSEQHKDHRAALESVRADLRERIDSMEDSWRDRCMGVHGEVGRRLNESDAAIKSLRVDVDGLKAIKAKALWGWGIVVAGVTFLTHVLWASIIKPLLNLKS